METDWDELVRMPVPPPAVPALPTVATTIEFDDVQELLWVGNEYVSFLEGKTKFMGLGDW